MPRKLTIRTTSQPAVVVARAAIRSNKLVYIACANKAIRYPRGRSKIVYIGTTQRGVRRITGSAANQAERLLRMRGVRELEFYVVTCASRAAVRSWQKLERGLILAFKDRFGGPPVGNRQGKNIFWDDELWYFTLRRLRRVIDYYSQ